MIDAQEHGYVTVAEAAKRLRVSHPTIWRWIKAGKLPAYRVGPKTIRIKEADLVTVVQPAVGPRRELALMRHGSSPATTITVPPLTEDERQRGREALLRSQQRLERMRRERRGQPIPSSWELIRQMREERSDELDRR